MALFRPKRQWNWSPSGLRPEFEALCPKLAFLLPLWEGAGDAVNVIDRTVMAKTATAEWALSPQGMAAYRPASATDEDHFVSGTYQPLDGSGDYTIWGTANPPLGTTGANNGSLFSQRITGAPFTQLGLYFNQDANGDADKPGYVTALHIGSGTIGTQATGILDGNWHSFASRKAGTTLSLFVDGSSRSSATVGGSATSGSQYVSIGGLAASDFGFGGSIGIVAAWNRALSDEEIALLETNWNGLVERQSEQIALVQFIASHSVAGTLAATSADDALTSAGTLPLAATLAATTVGDSFASSALLQVTGFATVTTAGDTLTSAAGGLIAGSLSKTEGSDSVASSAAVAIAATLASTAGGDTLAAGGSADTFGSLAATNDDGTLSGSGQLAIAGSLAVTTLADALAATAPLAVAGSVNAIEGQDTAVASGGADEVTSLWSHGVAPGSYDADLNDLTGGTVFYFTTPGQITGIWVYRTGQEWFSTGRPVGLYSIGGALLASGTGGTEAAGWNRIDLATPVTVEANTPYVAAAKLYTYQSQIGAFSSEVARGAIRAPATGNTSLTGSPIGNGRYIYASELTFPSTVAAGVSVFVDVEFTQSAATTGAVLRPENPDIVAAVGGLAITGSFSGVNAPDSLMSASVALGALVASERADALSGVAALAISGALAALAGIEKPDTVVASSTAGTTYYVRKTGSNSNPGTDASPKLTIAAGLALLQPGDSLIVGDGVYNESGLNASGTAAGWKTVRAENRGQAIISTTGNCFGGVAVSYFVIDGFRLLSSQGHGVEMSFSHHVKVLNCTPVGCSNSGVSFTQSDFITIAGNDCSKNAWSSWYSGISLYQCRNLLDDDTTGPRIFIQKNRCYDNFTNSFFTFGNGAAEIFVGDTITTSAGVSAKVDHIGLSSGSWAAGTAAGEIGVISRNGVAMASGANLQVGGVTKAVANSAYSGGPFTDGNGIIADDWQNNQISHVVINFSAGSTRIKPLDTINVALSGGGTANYTVDWVERTGGTWAGGNAAGRIGLQGTSGVSDGSIAASYPVAAGGAIKLGAATVATAVSVPTAKQNPPNYQFGAIIEDNVCFRNGAKGIQIAWAENCIVRNNTTYGNNLDLANTGTWRGDTSVQDSPGTILVNGIAWKSTAHASNSDINIAGTVSTAGSVVRNYLTRSAAPVVNDSGSYSNGGGNQWGVDPLFIDPVNGNFRLTTASPAVNVGTSAYGFSDTDIEGVGRTATTINLGAFEAIPGALGSFILTEAPDLVAANANLPIVAGVTATEPPDTLAAKGESIGSVTAIEAPDTLSSSAMLPITATLGQTESPDTGASGGEAAISGSVSRTEAADTILTTGASEAGAIFGSLVRPEQPDSLAAGGAIAITGSVAGVTQPDALDATAAVTALTGYAAATEAGDSGDLRGALAIVGYGAPSEKPDTLIVSVDPSAIAYLALVEGGDGLSAVGETSGVATPRLVLEDGTGIATSNAYATVEMVQIFCDSRGLTIPDGADVVGGLVRATDWIDGRFGRRFPGRRLKGRAQGCEWPREDATDANGEDLALDIVPEEVVIATILATLREIEKPGSLYPQPTPGAAVLRRRKVGPIDVEYDTSSLSTTTEPVVTAIKDVLAPLFSSGSGMVPLFRG